MSYRPTRFGAANLSRVAARGDLGPPPARNGIVETIGGFVDAYGAADAEFDLPYPLRWRCEVHEDTVGGLTAAVDELRGLVRQRQALWIEDTGSDTARWAWARLMRLPAEREWMHQQWQPVEFEWLVLSSWFGAWNETGADEGGSDGDMMLMGTEVAATVEDEDAFTVNNGGSIDVTAMTITLTAGSGNITAFTLTNTTTGHVLAYTGTVVAGQSLVIDTAVPSVKNNGVADYAHLTRPTDKPEWMLLQVGANVFDVEMTEAGSGHLLTFKFYDHYA